MADLSRQSLVDELKASLHQAVEYFSASADADFKRLLDIAALDMSRIRERIVKGSVTLSASTTEYAAPANIIRVTRTLWGRAQRRGRMYWDSNYIDCLPDLSVIETETGTRLELSREISAAELADIGAECEYFYQVQHIIGDTAADTTINAADRGLLILRAQAEAMSEAAFRNIGKPVQLRDGVSNTPRNGTPAALAEKLMKDWLAQGRGY